MRQDFSVNLILIGLLAKRVRARVARSHDLVNSSWSPSRDTKRRPSYVGNGCPRVPGFVPLPVLPHSRRRQCSRTGRISGLGASRTMSMTTESVSPKGSFVTPCGLSSHLNLRPLTRIGGSRRDRCPHTLPPIRGHVCDSPNVLVSYSVPGGSTSREPVVRPWAWPG